MARCRVSSSNWQSTGLQIRGLQVRALPDPLHDTGNSEQMTMALQAQLGKFREAGPRAVNFLGEVWAEMKKVHFPTRKETYAATVVVIVMVAISGLILTAFDWIWAFLANSILR